VNCTETAGDRPRQPASPSSVDFSSPSPDPLRPRRPAHAVVKEGYSLKSSYFPAIILSVVETVADRHRHIALMTCFLMVSTSMTLNNLELQKGVLVIFLRFSAVEELIATK